MKHLRRMDELLREQGSVLSTLVRGCHRRQALDSQFSALIDRPIADHVHVASAEDGILTLAADTPVWGHRIRYLAPSILEQLRRVDPALHEVKIIVRPPRSEPAAPDVHPRRAQISVSSASLLGGVANTCDNPRLASVLRRLSTLARPTDEQQ